MSRLFDAKSHTLLHYADDRENGVYYFVEFMDVSQSDIEYELGMSCEKYIYGDDKNE